MRTPKNVGGFTLIEMAVVAIILGIFAMLLTLQIKSAQFGAITDAILTIAEKSGQAHQLLVAKGIEDSTYYSMVAPGKDYQDIILAGKSALKPQYQALYDESGAKPIAGLVGQDIYGPGHYMVQSGSGISLSEYVGGSATTDTNAAGLTVRFEQVPIQVVQNIAERIHSGTQISTECCNVAYINDSISYLCQQEKCSLYILR